MLLLDAAYVDEQCICKYIRNEYIENIRFLGHMSCMLQEDIVACQKNSHLQNISFAELLQT